MMALVGRQKWQYIEFVDVETIAQIQAMQTKKLMKLLCILKVLMQAVPCQIAETFPSLASCTLAVAGLDSLKTILEKVESVQHRRLEEFG